MQNLISMNELDAVLAGPALKLPALDLDELLEIAAECDERGPLATVNGLLEALRMRHSDDETTCVILAALERYHLPALLDAARG